ncbi:hypothetical protein BH11PLA1_BH11PLA1_08020 [soil metagenome]
MARIAHSGARKRRNLLIVQALIGLAMTSAALALWFVGALDSIEGLTLDRRAQWFGTASPGPSDKIRIIAIDQAALDNIGNWPWPRRDLAAVITELRRAGVKVIALDLLLDDPDTPRWVPRRPIDGIAPGKDAPRDTVFALSSGDQELEGAIREHGGVIAATGFQFLMRETEGEGAEADVGASGVALGSTETKPSAPAISKNAAAPRRVERVTTSTIYAQVARNPALLTMPFDAAVRQLAIILLPPETRNLALGPDMRNLTARIGAARVLLTHEEDSSISGAGVPGAERFASAPEPAAPVASVGLAAARIANVTFDSYDADGQARRIPLWVEHHGRMWPNLGLAGALLFENAPMSGVHVSAHETTAETPEGVKRLAIFQSRVKAGVIGGLHFVTWPRALAGKPFSDAALAAWQWPFYDMQRNAPAEISIGRIFEPASQERRLAANLRTIEGSVLDVITKRVTPGTGSNGGDTHLSAEDEKNFRKNAEAIANLSTDNDLWSDYADANRAIAATAVAGAQRERAVLVGAAGSMAALTGEAKSRVEYLDRSLNAIELAQREIDGGVANITRVRAELKRMLGGTLCFVGWTATGSLADFVGTSIAPRTPGVHLHAAIASSVLTGFQKRPGAAWVDPALIILGGALGTIVGMSTSVLAAPVVSLVIAAAWFGVCGYFVWDVSSLVVSFTGPTAALILGVLGVFAHRLLVEQSARRRTEERFKSRVAPQLVDLLVNNPELDTMKPQRRELSVMFTDLQGFTTTAERLGEQKTAELLAAFLGTMTDIVLKHGATFDKYIGDAIVVFWGAPIENPRHAADACRAVLEMQRTLDEMNAAGRFAEVGPCGLVMRAGLSAGDVMVGDFGAPPKNSSYTTLGDTTNLASRLEGANKAFGSRILVSERFKTLAEEHAAAQVAAPRARKAASPTPLPLRWRGVGRVRVKGKAEPIALYELVGDLQPHGARTDEWIALTGAVVATYARGDFDACDAALETMQREFGSTPMCDLYRDQMIEWAARVDRATAFDGTIELKEK